jgi:hypothetical protein
MKLNEHYSPETMKWLDKVIRKYEIQEDGSVNVLRNLSLAHDDFTEFPVKFGNIYGHFDVSFCVNLTKLNGPYFVEGDADFEGCYDLQSLENGPSKVDGYFDISKCQNIRNLKGGPVKVGTHYRITSCINFSSLEGIAREIFGHGLIIEDCPKLKSLDFIPTVNGPSNVTIKNTPIFNFLRLLKIPNLQTVTLSDTFTKFDGKQLEQIIQKYLPLGDIMDCQEEMIEAGFSKYARLK